MWIGFFAYQNFDVRNSNPAIPVIKSLPVRGSKQHPKINTALGNMIGCSGYNLGTVAALAEVRIGHHAANACNSIDLAGMFDGEGRNLCMADQQFAIDNNKVNGITGRVTKWNCGIINMRFRPDNAHEISHLPFENLRKFGGTIDAEFDHRFLLMKRAASIVLAIADNGKRDL